MEAHAPLSPKTHGESSDPNGAVRAFEVDERAGQRVLDAIQLWRTAWDIVEGTLRAEHPDWPTERVLESVRQQLRGA